METPSNNEDQPFLFLRKLSKHYGTAVALDGVSLEVAEAEILGLIGPSGSGKTTLLRCVDLLTDFDSGSVGYWGRYRVSASLNGMTIGTEEGTPSRLIEDGPATSIRREIGYVFQGFNLWEERSVLSNLTLAPRIVGKKSRQQAADEAADICREFGLENKLSSKPWQLSGGQRQRVALVRALLMHPRILLLDEITSALDPVLTFDVMEAVRTLQQRRMTMIVVTHHLQFASRLCDRIAFLEEGRCIQVDTPEVLQAKPASPSVARFLEILEETR